MSDVSWPMCGPCYIRGNTVADATQLRLRVSRAATQLDLYADINCKGPALTAMERLLRERPLMHMDRVMTDGAVTERTATLMTLGSALQRAATTTPGLPTAMSHGRQL